MLEYNLFDNFNPNVYRLRTVDPNNPNGGHMKSEPYPDPKARGVVMDFELWHTGYKYTSSAVLSTKAVVGDILQVFLNEDVHDANWVIEKTGIAEHIMFVVTDVEEGGRVTLQNYYWAMLEGVEQPVGNYKGSDASSFLIAAIDPLSCRLPIDSNLGDGQRKELKLNVKTDTVDSISVVKKATRVLKFQPIIRYNNDEKKIINIIKHNSDRYITTRIDDKQNPSIETEIVTERSNYNYLSAYVKASETAYYPWQRTFTINNKDEVVNLKDYKGDGYDLPSTRITKTVFYDTEPTTGQVRSEISKSSTISNIYFNQNELLRLYTNDWVNLWFNGITYSGYIADRCFTGKNGIITERVLFVESGEK